MDRSFFNPPTVPSEVTPTNKSNTKNAAKGKTGSPAQAASLAQRAQAMRAEGNLLPPSATTTRKISLTPAALSYMTCPYLPDAEDGAKTSTPQPHSGSTKISPSLWRNHDIARSGSDSESGSWRRQSGRGLGRIERISARVRRAIASPQVRPEITVSLASSNAQGASFHSGIARPLS
jgi:hypothetical protein